MNHFLKRWVNLKCHRSTKTTTVNVGLIHTPRLCANARLSLPAAQPSFTFSQNRKRAAVRWNGGLGVIIPIGGQRCTFVHPTLWL